MRRLRRLRQTPQMRKLVAEVEVTAKDLIMPFFIVEGEGITNPIGAMPNICQYSIDRVLIALEEVVELGINTIMLFGVPEHKDECGSGAYDDNGIIQRAIRAIKAKFPTLLVIGDVCLCEYTSHGHCGLIKDNEILNDETLPVLAKLALSLARAGADIVAPSDMMDGRVEYIRNALDEEGFHYVPIMSYSVKYASNLYGPFREAALSSPQFGDRKSYQMNYLTPRDAGRAVNIDIRAGADFIVVKPATFYLDIIQNIKETIDCHIVAYDVSGEYSMIKAAAKEGWLDEVKLVHEKLTAIKRAGASTIITYHAIDYVKWQKEGLYEWI